jgi:hypothetical protein
MSNEIETKLPVDAATACSAWLESNDADDHCGCLRLTAEQLRPIVIARCQRRARRKVLLKTNRECDPCVCGCLSTYHTECYVIFAADHAPKNPPATEKHALPWRAKISSQNDERVHHYQRGRASITW